MWVQAAADRNGAHLDFDTQWRKPELIIETAREVWRSWRHPLLGTCGTLQPVAPLASLSLETVEMRRELIFAEPPVGAGSALRNCLCTWLLLRSLPSPGAVLCQDAERL
jgi:hypothetical protein